MPNIGTRHIRRARLLLRSRATQHIASSLECADGARAPDEVRVAEVDGGDDLAEETARLARRQSPLADQVVEELAARHVLQDQVAAIEHTMYSLRMCTCMEHSYK